MDNYKRGRARRRYDDPIYKERKLYRSTISNRKLEREGRGKNRKIELEEQYLKVIECYADM